MYVVTNRQVDPDASGLAKFGPKPNAKGPNELRMFEITGTRSIRVSLVDDAVSEKEAASVGYTGDEPCTGSCYVAHRMLRDARKNKRNVLFFVHGYNNDMKDVVKRALAFETNFGVDVVAFSWPADGGGLRGAAHYKSDKRDAKASIGALDRALAKMSGYLDAFTDSVRRELLDTATRRHPDNPEARDALLTQLTEKECPVRISMLIHSMGNYLYKHLLLSSASEGNSLLFDNVILASADANNKDHRDWVDRIRCRRRIYVTLNENDHALRLSRIKTGQEQLARLGHYPFELNAARVVYADFTSASWVRESHAYFEGAPVSKNKRVRDFFRSAVNGEIAETGLRYRDDRNLYEIGP